MIAISRVKNGTALRQFLIQFAKMKSSDHVSMKVVIRIIHEYAVQKELISNEDPRIINCDNTLENLFGKKIITDDEMPQIISSALSPVDEDDILRKVNDDDNIANESKSTIMNHKKY